MPREPQMSPRKSPGTGYLWMWVQEENLGYCTVVREYRSCFRNGAEIRHGNSFQDGCTPRCVCDNGNFKCEPLCEIPAPPLLHYCTKMHLEKEPGQCCKKWSCSGYKTAAASREHLTLVEDPTTKSQDRTPCFVDGKEYLQDHAPHCPATRPEPVPDCVEMHLESVPGLCCKKWKCNKYGTKENQEYLREMEARLNLNVPVVFRKFHSCINDRTEIRHGQRFQQGCQFNCECHDGLPFCRSLCPPAIPDYFPGCTDMREVSEPGACCKQWSCTKKQHMDMKITMEAQHHQTSEAKVAEALQVDERTTCSGCTGGSYNNPNPTAEEESPPPLPEKKQGCPQECRCPVNPKCPPGSPLVQDTCGCGCKVCAGGFSSVCDGLRPCDATQNLTCHYLWRKEEDLGYCNVIREYRSCFRNGAEVRHGDAFVDGCTARCVCDNGNFKCEPLCEIPAPPLLHYCTKMHLEKEPGQCCKEWSCSGYKTAAASREHLTLVEDPTTKSQDRTPCFVDGKEYLQDHAPHCPATRPEPVPDCVEMHLESVPGLCCKKWKCNKYGTKENQEYLREMEARLNLNVPVVIRKFHSCFNDSTEIRHGQRFQQGCAFDCHCSDGLKICRVLCPPALPDYLPNCIDFREVSEPGACCKQWKCTKYKGVDDKTTIKAQNHQTSEAKVADALQVREVIREYRSCFNNGTEIGHGDTFDYGCTARCACDDGHFKCEPICKTFAPPLIHGCSKLHLEKGQGQCCENWSCKEYNAEDTQSSQGSLIVFFSIKEGGSSYETQVDATRQSCFVDGKEILHGQKFKDGCRYLCICSNGKGLCLPLCPPTQPEPVPGCVEMHLESVPGRCCKKWKCKEYKAVDTQEPVEDLSELETRLSLNAPVPGKCCKEWKCLKYQQVEGDVTVETLYHPTSEDEVDDTVQVKGVKSRRSSREAPHTAGDTSVVQTSSCDMEPTEWTPCSRPCGLGRSTRVTYDPESCSPQAEKRRCMVKPCRAENSNASYRERRMIRG
uniref:VWFC domain-containing protein n=1 Tax=Leptobrachium leishanense TaxID=445787 RepID=A0A8C5QSP7_9ANUR